MEIKRNILIGTIANNAHASIKDSLQAEISRSSPAELYKAQVASVTCHPSDMSVFVSRDLKMVHYKCCFIDAIHVMLAIVVIRVQFSPFIGFLNYLVTY